MSEYLRWGAYVDALDNDGGTALQYAVFTSQNSVVEALLAAGAQVELVCAGGLMPLQFAGSCADGAVVETLLRAGARVDARTAQGGETALHYAAATGRDTALLALLRAGADLNATTDNGDTPMRIAIAARRINAMVMLMTWGVCLREEERAQAAPIRGSLGRVHTLTHMFFVLPAVC